MGKGRGPLRPLDPNVKVRPHTRQGLLGSLVVPEQDSKGTGLESAPG